MGDEVTKKDLQSLQGYVNKKIADLDAKLTKGLSDETAKLNKTIDHINKTVEQINEGFADLTKLHNDQQATLIEHAKVINQLGKEIKERD